jgi:hypothetical protein
MSILFRSLSEETPGPRGTPLPWTGGQELQHVNQRRPRAVTQGPGPRPRNQQTPVAGEQRDTFVPRSARLTPGHGTRLPWEAAARRLQKAMLVGARLYGIAAQWNQHGAVGPHGDRAGWRGTQRGGELFLAAVWYRTREEMTTDGENWVR